MDKNNPTDYENNLFSNHFLEERIQDTEKWQETNVEEKFNELKKLYDSKSDLLSEKLNEDQTQSKFINPVLKALGHKWVPEARTRVGSKKKGTILNPDYTFMDMETQMEVHNNDEKSYFDVNYAVGDAKAWNRKLDKSTQDHSNPAFQIYNYVDRLRADWGILTNGKKWRIYSYEKCAADIYFEIDLENLLKGEKTEEKLEQFKYFYLLFERGAFEQGFLQKVYQESVNFAEGLEDDLEDKVYNALEVAVEGFFETNNLDKTEENIDLVHHASLIFLYRVLFILNAESRDLLPTDDKAYQQAFGLMELKRMIVEGEETHIFRDTTIAWDKRISRLFEGIEDGYDLSETEIPAYNGGLFDEEDGEENRFLAKNKLYGSYIKEILELLATSYDEEKEKRIILDYKDLNIRHLGSVYEGLLEHRFKAADERKILKNGEWIDLSETNKDWEEFEEEKRAEENELYLTNESGERKATGSYYTPEYIVEYIVENTVGPKVEEKISEAEENNSNVLTNILELNVCDPAMGSGHFLTEATEYIAERIVQHADLEKQNLDENEDELNWAKRQVVQNCIYGVDVNELAVELGKLSLWIETAARGKPLNFLDHHLKHGNSLIGSDFDEILKHPHSDEQKSLDNDRFQFGGPEEIKENLEERYREIEEKPENTVEQIHEKEKEYKEFIKENEDYKQFKQLANIHTRQYFQEEVDQTLYENMLLAIGTSKYENQKEYSWFQSAQRDAENRNYFHWQLEFPKVFFGQQEGFDAVVGNPPYARNTNLPEGQKVFYKKYYETSHKQYDIYILFMEKAKNLLNDNDELGFIISNKFMASSYGKNIRNFMLENYSINEITDVSTLGVFGDASVYPCIVSFSNCTPDTDHSMDIAYRVDSQEKLSNNSFEVKKLEQSEFKNNDQERFLINLSSEEMDIVQKLEKETRLGEISEIIRGTPNTEIEEIDDDLSGVKEKISDGKYKYKALESTDILKYAHKHSGGAVIHDDSEAGLSRRKTYDDPKILMPRTVLDIKAAFDDEGYYIRDRIYVISLENKNLAKQTAGFLNSSLIQFNYDAKFESTHVSGGYYDLRGSQLEELPIKTKNEPKLDELVEEMIELRDKLNSVNLNIQDYLGNYSDGKTLGDLYTPVEGLSDRVVSGTSADWDSLRIGGVEFEERNDELILKVSARYKPDDSENIDESELDRWGYLETEKVPAMKFNVEDKMRPLIEEFVSLAVDEAGGFAGFRESATKTNSVIDRLEKLTLPKLEDVEQSLEKFIENKEEAEELEEKIQETDELIDAIVFDLYDLTEEEVETVLDSLDTKEGERGRILQRFIELN